MVLSFHVAPEAEFPEAQQCQDLAQELWQCLSGADGKWRALEKRLREAEELCISEHAGDLQKWFGKEVLEKLSDKAFQQFAQGSLHRKIRDRVETLLLVPLDKRICQADIQLFGAGAAEAKSHPIDVLLEHWETVIKPSLEDVIKEDAKILRKLRRLEKVCDFRNAKVQQQKRAALWIPMREALAAVEGPVRALALLLNTDLGAEAVSKAVAAVPGIVARSVCDWHYQRCNVEFEQLSSWWQGTRAALESRPELWERLVEQEGLFMRRIERGIDEIHKEKCRYVALANFGHSGAVPARPGQEWPAESASLLARSVNEMQRRLRPVRDCAAYRIIDTATSVLKAIADEELSKERSPWEQIGNAEGISSLCHFLEIPGELTPGDLQNEPQGLKACGHLDPADVVLRFSSVLDGLVRAISDLAKLPDDMAVPDTGGVSYIMEEVLQAILYVQEDLLVVLDDASEASLSAWLSESWGEWCVVSAGGRLDKAMNSMPLKGDSKLPPKERQARRSRLALMRGLQMLLDDSRFRVLLLELAVTPQEARTSAVVGTAADIVSPTKDKDELIAAIEPFHQTRSEASVLASPRSGYVPRKPEKCSHEEVPAAELSTPSPPVVEESAQPEVAPECEARSRQPSAQPEVASPVRQSRPETPSRLRGSSTPAGQRKSKAQEFLSMESPVSSLASCGAATSLHKAAPSWLAPPWPRPQQEVPFDSWSRPCTPSTVCDENDLSHSPKMKLIDGQLVSLRLGASCKRLPPINDSALSASMRSKVWR